MNRTNLSWLRRAPLLLAAAALAACSSDQQSAPTAQEPQAWTLVVSVSKTDAPIVDATRGVGTNDDGETLVSCWTAGTTVEVYDGETLVGTLRADASSNGHTLLRGTITGTYTPGVSTLQLYSPAKTLDYSGQTGTVASISQKDFLNGTITVTRVSFNNKSIESSDCQFTRLQAFTKFTFDFSMKSLRITADGLVGSPLTVTTASETESNTFYVALRNTEPGVKKQYSFFGTTADGRTTFIGTKYGTLVYGDYSQTCVDLQPSLDATVSTTWTEGDDLGSSTLQF